MDNVTLVGMPGSGKSTIGVLLAKRLGFSFIDVDLVIQEKEQRLLKEIIEDEGLDGFLALENRINSHLEAHRAIIAPGGSVIYGQEAMAHLKDIGIVVYIKIDYPSLVQRLGDLTDRGVVLKDGMTLMDLYQERVPLYEQYADITIDEGTMTPGQIVDELRDILEERFGYHRKLNYIEMTSQHLPQMADLFTAAFNAPPWNDKWTYPLAKQRLSEMMDCSGFSGMVVFDEDDKLLGLIMGNSETFYDGIRFHIREFCVDVTGRGGGIGRGLLKRFEKELHGRGIDEVYLSTSKSNGTTKYYLKHGYTEWDSMAQMSKKLS